MKTKILLLGFCVILTLNCFAITWTGPENISGSNSEASEVDFDGSGNATALWVHFDGSNEIIQSAIYNGTWNTPVSLSSGGFNANSHKISVSDSGGYALAIWQLYDGTNLVIQAAAYSGGTWGTPETISTANENGFEPHVAINSSGDGFAVWTESTNAFDVIMVAFYSGGTWGNPQILSNITLESATPMIALNDSGTAIAAWVAYDPFFAEFSVQGASYTSGNWNALQTLSTSGANSILPKVVINSSGDGFAIWERNNDPLLNLDLIAVSHFNGTSWGLQTVISDPIYNASLPSIAMNDSGNAAAVWQNSNGSIHAAGAIYSAGLWASPQSISSLPLNSLVKVGIDGNDTAIAIWSEDSGGSSMVSYAETSSGTYGSPIGLSVDAGFAPKIGVNPSGDAVATWDAFDGSDYLIQAAIGVP